MTPRARMRASPTRHAARQLHLIVRPHRTLEELPELLDRQARIASNTAHGEGVDRVRAREGQNALAVRHHDVLALAHHPKARLLECARTAWR